MKRQSFLWSKHVKCELINRDMTVADLAEKIGRTKEYTSAVVNMRIIAESVAKEISDFLNIPDSGYFVTGNLIISRKGGGEHGERPDEG